MRRLSLLFVFALIVFVTYTAFAADTNAERTSTYKAELSGQEEVPAVQPAPGEAQPAGEATFELSRPQVKGGGAGGAGETGAAGSAGGQAKKGGADSSYYSGILDRINIAESRSAGTGAGGGTAKSVSDGNYYSGILDRVKIAESQSAGTGAGGGTAKSVSDGNYYIGILNSGQSSGSAAGGTAGDVLHYKLNVKDIKNVTAAHLHMGKKGTPTSEAPVIAPLYTGPEKTGTFSGMLAEGTITSKDLKGPMSGKTIQDLAKLMDKGEVFVNVHTAQYPAGEIRGEVAPR